MGIASAINTTASYYLCGIPEMGNTIRSLKSLQDGSILAEVAYADAAILERAIAAMSAVMPTMRKLSGIKRRRICETVYTGLLARQEDFARMIAQEAGKPIKSARGEVGRALTTFRLAMEESTRIGGEQLPVDIDERSEGYHCVIERIPAGPAVFITPFNFPLNLVAHKVAPALACGCPFVLKPSDRTPLTALLLGELLAQADMPPGSWSILPTAVENVKAMISDPRVRIVSFTGSVRVGWALQAQAVGKRVLLELGSNSAVVVESDADIADAVSRIIPAAFGYSGQSCISVQRIYVHKNIAPDVIARLVTAAKALRIGPPLDETTDVSCMIDEAAARRVATWVQEALAAGATLLCGGRRDGAWYYPTLLSHVPATARVACEEVFGPVAIIEEYDNFSAVLTKINASTLGIHAGVFTKDLFKARQAFETLEVGGVIINDVPTMRIDAMPYGGVKQSGLGREGVRFAIEHLTELKTLVTRYA
ncbi:MAG: aldehyde dehydrogenase family protein [Phycisphaerae bacterium]